MRLWEDLTPEEIKSILDSIAKQDLLDSTIDVEYQAYYLKMKPKEFIKKYLGKNDL